jgi:hypothetical protein
MFEKLEDDEDDEDDEEDLEELTDEVKARLKKEKEIFDMKKGKADKRMKKRILNIKALEFDWIFNNKEGKNFLHMMSKTKDIELFSNELIK